MTDFFALLNLPRRPRIDLESLKANYLELSSQTHPDRMAGASSLERQQAADAYTRLNEAYQTLRESKSRLHHLISLECGRKPGDSQELPESLMSMFATIGPLLRQADALVKAKASSNSALERAMTTTKALPCLQQIAQARSQLQQQREQLDATLAQLDQAWITGDPAVEPGGNLIARAEALYHHFGFLDRWSTQLQEREFELTL
jgi:curved DNA-binding protein CbpA